MSCNNCSNGCLSPQTCACDCTTCAAANACNIPIGDTGPQGPAGSQGLPGINGINGQNGTNGTDGCTLIDMYISDGTDGNTVGDIIVTTGPTPTPCNSVLNIGNLISTIVNNGGASIPAGIIVMWSGTIPNIPLGWQLADGSNFQPDLRGRFIASYLAGDPNFGGILGPGGALSQTLSVNNIPAHVHDIGTYTAVSTCSTVGNHRHQQPGQNGTGGGILDKGGGSGGVANYWGLNAGAHTHIVTTALSGNSGDGQAGGLNFPTGASFPIIPLYYTLAFIIKL